VDRVAGSCMRAGVVGQLQQVDWQMVAEDGMGMERTVWADLNLRTVLMVGLTEAGMRVVSRPAGSDHILRVVCVSVAARAGGGGACH
jgi:endonuclease V-like protein UPF0215 family